MDVPLVARGWAAVTRRFPDVAPARLIPELVRETIGVMVNDVIAETRRRLEGIADVEGVRQAGRALAGFSPPMAAEERQLKAFLYAHMYDAPPVTAVRRAAQSVLAGLFAAYRDDPRRLPEDWRPASDDPVATLRTIGDFIAGMTDRYAIGRYEELVGPADVPEGF
jgi:dGTPase